MPSAIASDARVAGGLGLGAPQVGLDSGGEGGPRLGVDAATEPAGVAQVLGPGLTDELEDRRVTVAVTVAGRPFRQHAEVVVVAEQL